MLRFFRHIRKSLMETNHFRKYFLYALGEIALVVIGILIALNINNWNQYQQARVEEQRILSSIGAELGNLSWQSRRGYDIYKDVVKYSNSLLSVLQQPASDYNIDSLEHYLAVITNRWMFGKSNVTNIYDALAASGELKFIESDELRTNLTYLDRQLLLLSVYEDLHNDFVNTHLRPFLNEYMDGISVYKERSKYLIYNFNFSPEGEYVTSDEGRFKTDSKMMFNNRKFSNLLIDHIRNSSSLIPIYERIINYIETIESLKNEKIQ
ncbi:MAG: hypothetical protein HKN68_00040 [Saprospiraceae bacterium]|nr:hypothetical protein [Saprospiraceae bacterium]